jgi:hypothetical protein
VAFFQAVKVLLTKREISTKKQTNEELELAIRQIIGSTLYAQEYMLTFHSGSCERRTTAWIMRRASTIKLWNNKQTSPPMLVTIHPLPKLAFHNKPLYTYSYKVVTWNRIEGKGMSGGILCCYYLKRMN